jgi:hypothetical protein
MRQWWRATIAAAAFVSPHAAAADQPVHEGQIVATRFAFEPATIRVTADFSAPPPGQYEIGCSAFCGGGHGCVADIR